MFGLKPAVFALDVDVLRVVECATALFHRVTQDVMNRLKQTSTGLLVKPRRQPIVTQSRTMQDLVGVDVADTGDASLIEQQRLQVAATTAQYLGKLRFVETLCHGVGAEPCQLWRDSVLVIGIEDHHLAEGARVDEPHLVTHGICVGRKMRHHVGMRRTFGASWHDEHPPTHA